MAVTDASEADAKQVVVRTGETAQLTIVRNGERRTVTVTVRAGT